MADTTAVSQDPVHQEGVDHIKAKLEETSISAPTEPAPSAAAHTQTSPAITTEPPASNPGADDKTGGIAADAGGLSGSANADIPNPAVARPNAEKRKSVFGSFKGIFSKKDKEVASDGTYLGAATAAATAAAAAVTETVQAYTGTGTAETKPETTTTTGADSAADEKPALAEQKAAEAEASTAGTTNAPAALTTTDGPAGAAETEGTGPAAAAAKDEEAAKDVAASGEGTSKDVQTHRQNPEAIPTAGGKPVGADHIGESKIVPEDPGAQPTDDATLARITGQPKTETADNTAANTGSATDPTAEKKKGGFMSKIKERLNKKKE